MYLLTAALLFVLGACFGSFLNVLIDRLPSRRSIFFSRSECEHCRKKIKNQDLIPLVSYIILGGKCRYCKKKIGTRVFVVELLSAIVFVLLYTPGVYTNWIAYSILALISLILLAISVIDIEKGIIPDKLLVLLGVLSIPYIAIIQGNSLTFHIILSHLVTGISAFAFFLIIFLITRGRGIGFGDVKYAFFIGFLLNFTQLIICFYAAFLTGAAVSLILVLARVKKLRGESIPFGPFLSLGLFMALVFEKEILDIARVFLHF